ncbi:16S rRNA (uracil(1498)-N(3))-methyltransferase [Aerococcus agrisoli]|uniref:Ribosomal RNA small subunit methyltransferase E n=1 Tax=Aerococcus agrisoli TaxID=2487350 RepID=A0A3N4FYY0_9LACT|nr:16S rRNA (uracil(1498)-N(3))-methyltransferase [Aerococcus agrisoli]RPA55912.1 16S rRNA (uracil(1498)-N(3))-methyltransferase [Aerococcus agrisoli]
MQRYFVDVESLTVNDDFQMDKEASHHMLTVMRMQAGDKAYVVTQSQQVFIGELVDSQDKMATLHLAEEVHEKKELDTPVTLFVGLPKNDKLEWIVQKATELGASQIVPVAMRYSVTKWDQKKAGKKIERLQKIAQEAAEQAHRTFVPQIGQLVTTKEMAQMMGQFDRVCVAYEEVAKQGEKHRLVQVFEGLETGHQLAFVTGPEGGFHPDEIELLQEDHDNVFICGLGPRILRAETAPMYMLSALSYARELL